MLYLWVVKYWNKIFLKGGYNVRVQMRLSKEGRVVLEELKLEYLKNDEYKTSGIIVDEIFGYLKNDFYKINWGLVQSKPEYDGILADYTSVNPTTLNLANQTIDTVDEFRNYFNQALNMKRTVYRSFIIRIVLKAFKLKKDGINIYL